MGELQEKCESFAKTGSYCFFLPMPKKYSKDYAKTSSGIIQLQLL